MRIKDLKELINGQKELIAKQFNYVEWEQLDCQSLGKRVYSLNLRASLDMKPNFLEAIGITSNKPYLGFFFDLSKHQDEEIKKEVIAIFSNFSRWLEGLDNSLIVYEKKIDYLV